LRDVVLEVNAASANIRFAAYSGMPFQAQQILSVKPTVDQKTVDTAVLKAEKLLEIMNGSLDQVWEDYRSSDTMIPKTFAYFNLRKTVITDLVASLDEDLKKGGLPFMAGLEIMVSLKKAWAFIDRSVGMATKNEKTLQNVMNLPQTSVTGSYFSEQGAALVKPLSNVKREIPVYDLSKASGSSWFDRKNSGSNNNSDGYNN